MPSKLRALWELVRDAVHECTENKVLRLAAALAYYATFSLAPLLLLAVAVVGAVVGEETAESEVAGQLEGVAGSAAAEAIRTLLTSRDALGPDLSTTLIGVFGLLLGSSALFNHLKDSLNIIWQVAPRPDRGLRGLLLDRVLALIMVLCVAVVGFTGFGLAVELTAVARAISAELTALPPWYAVRGVQLALSLVTATALVALTFRVLPDTHIAWPDIWVGAAATALLIVLSQALIGLYLRSSQLSSAYSAIGAAVILLIWVYFSAVVFFFGAELTWVYANRYGSRIVPAGDAVALTTGDRAAQGMLRAAELVAVAQLQEQAQEQRAEAERQRAVGE